MDRVKVTQDYLNRLPTPTDMPNVPWVQWRVENMEELLRFLEPYVVRVKRIPGDQVLIQTPVVNSDLQLSPGDCLVIEKNGGKERLGIVRARNSVPHREADGIKPHKNKRLLDPKDKEISHGF